jgi:hypothetical protein
MSEYLYNIEQGTPEWHQVRLGLITASVVKNLLTSTFKISQDKKIKLLAFELAAQRITGRIDENPKVYNFERGHIEEEIARDLYAEHHAPVQECGFIIDGYLGYSPDGLVGADGLIEIKSRVQKYQVQTIVEECTPSEYMIQLQTGLLVSGRQWIDFIQYSNGMEMFVERVKRNEPLIATIKEATANFENEICSIVEAYRSKSWQYIKAEYVDYSLEASGMQITEDLEEASL